MPVRRRARDAGVISPNLTPLLDVVLQLITFFMMLIHFGSQLEGETGRVRLPVAPAALPGGDLGLDRLAVAMDARGRLLVEGDLALDDAAAARWWTEQAGIRRAGLAALGVEPDAGGGRAPGEALSTQVILRADRDATYGAVRRALLAAQEAGFAQFSLIVLRAER